MHILRDFLFNSYRFCINQIDLRFIVFVCYIEIYAYQLVQWVLIHTPDTSHNIEKVQVMYVVQEISLTQDKVIVSAKIMENIVIKGETPEYYHIKGGENRSLFL